ncbi:Metallo-hydrolase/oxidoreductase [Wolfiporia cocos MD-104 SS10]|uniref:Metallo-hydrolase/oxidoreductase n=1 Tax=Wolfiporia cocos (strain MD-104) TaxID=742152 RepID=A0A2H3IYF5_WOLCO|nr:Metallo-hydrolase/oxidoreductase [Wolfiporia cocos MD-104 SS10]
MLTPDIEGQKYVLVYALHAGSFYLPDKEVFEDSLEAKTGSQVPSFAFLIEHDVHGRLMFDPGLRKHGQGYPPAWEETLQEFTVDCPRDVVDLLEEGGVSPSSIRTVVYSHLHFDHVGDLAPFTSAEVILGGEAAELMEDTYPRNPDSLWQEFPAGHKVCYIDFETDQRGLSPLGSFNRAVDFFRDGSLYLLDAPGHFPGHLAALARVSTNKFVLLAADCCHNRLCYNPGHRLISRENYHDVQVARDTVQRLKIMDRTEGVLVILAHERERLDEMPLFPNSLNHRAQTQIGKKTNAS